MIIPTNRVREDAKLPVRASDFAVGSDVLASRVLDKKDCHKVIQDLPVEIPPNKVVLIGTGIRIAVPWGYQCEVKPRSGLAIEGIRIANAPGTIDPDYTGEVGVLLWNIGEKPFRVEKDMRIAQLVFTPAEIPEFVETKGELPKTRRGPLGFGDTGLFGPGLGTEEYQKRIREMDEYYMTATLAISERSECIRGVKKINGEYQRDSRGKIIGRTRKFGCIIVKNDNIIGQGFNAPYPGSEKCEKVGCLRDAENIPSGTMIERCRAMHAEWLTLLKLTREGISAKGATMYLNAEPCEVCARLIAGSGIETVVMLEGVYPTNGKKILQEAGISIRYVKI